MRTNLHDLVAQAATERPQAPAVTYRHETWDYGRLWRECLSVAGALRKLGLGREDRVGVYLDKRLETVAALYGTSAAGGVFVPVNPVLRPQQVAYILADCAVSVLITSSQRLHQLADVLAGCPALRHVVTVDPPADEPTRTFAVHAWDAAVARAGDEAPHSGIDADTAAIIYTSGSTGRPKGVVLSHRNLIVGAESVSTYLHNSPDDVLLAALPLSFDAGLSQLTTACSVGAHVVLMNYLLPRDVPRLCAEHRVTGLTCVPPLWNQIVDQEWPEEARASLRYFANTGGRMPRRTLGRLREHFPAARPYLMYGLTEAFRSTYLDPAEVDRRPESIGKAIPDAEVLVLRPDGTRCAPGEEGELVHRGPLVALGYWDDAARTAERFRPIPGRDPAWRAPEAAVWSGDAAVMDEEGYLYFVARKDEMIKTSGYRVSPTEVEEAAYSTGLVQDAAAFGVADEDLGQVIVLVVAPSGSVALDPKEVLAGMRPLVPTYMLPARVEVRESLPRSPNGKLDRAQLREELVP